MELNKELIQKIYDNNVTDEEVDIFLSEHIKNVKGKYPTPEQLQAIHQLVVQGVFKLDYALIQAAHNLGLTVIKIFDKNNRMIKATVCEP